MIKIPEHALTLAAYQAGKSIGELAREAKLGRIVKLASNENALGTSPMALAALKEAVDDLHRYVDPRSTELTTALGARFGRDPSEIFCAHGTDAILAYIINAFTTEQDELLTSEGSFIGLYVSTGRLARKLRLVPLKEYALDLDRLAEGISDRTKIVYLANPNNPTGTMFSATEFEAFMQRVPEDVLVLLDEAYDAYAAEFEGYPDGLHYRYDNLIVARSLSKVYGLAGLRVGFAAGPKYLIDTLYRVKLPFEPNRPAQVAAEAALADDEFIERTLAVNRRSRAQLEACFESLKIPYVKSVTNFVLILLADETKAADFFGACLRRGLIVRHVKPFGIANGVRISTGNEADTAFAVDVITRAWEEISQPAGAWA
jgi:histidinol-phosphate aminotransferase